MISQRIRTAATTVAIMTLPWIAKAEDSSSLQPPFGSATSQTEPVIIIAVIIQALLGLVGAGALLMFVLGGFYMIFSAGNEERVTKGKRILVWAVVGMVVILSSYAILSFVFSLFQVAAS